MHPAILILRELEKYEAQLKAAGNSRALAYHSIPNGIRTQLQIARETWPEDPNLQSLTMPEHDTNGSLLQLITVASDFISEHVLPPDDDDETPTILVSKVKLPGFSEPSA